MMTYLTRVGATGATDPGSDRPGWTAALETSLQQALADYDAVPSGGARPELTLRVPAPSADAAAQLARLLVADAAGLELTAAQTLSVEPIPAAAAPPGAAHDTADPHRGGEHVFAAHLELAETDPSDEQLDLLTDELAEYGAVAGVSGYGYLTIQLDIGAADFVQAGLRAQRLVTAAVRHAGVGRTEWVQLEVLATVDELERRAELPPPALMPELVSKAEAAQILGITVSAMDNHARAGHFGAMRVGNAWVFPRVLVAQEKERRDARGA